MDPLKTKPVLYDDLYSDYEAFVILNASRQAGFSVGPISISDIHALMQILDIDQIEERKMFLRRIKILDNAYLEFENGRSETKKPGPKKQRKNKK